MRRKISRNLRGLKVKQTLMHLCRLLRIRSVAMYMEQGTHLCPIKIVLFLLRSTAFGKLETIIWCLRAGKTYLECVHFGDCFKTKHPFPFPSVHGNTTHQFTWFWRVLQTTLNCEGVIRAIAWRMLEVLDVRSYFFAFNRGQKRPVFFLFVWWMGYTTQHARDCG